MNTDILTITSTNKRENSNLHSNTSMSYLYHSSRKIEKSEVLLMYCTTKYPTQLQKHLTSHR